MRKIAYVGLVVPDCRVLSLIHFTTQPEAACFSLLTYMDTSVDPSHHLGHICTAVRNVLAGYDLHQSDIVISSLSGLMEMRTVIIDVTALP